ncbi:MAG: LPS-assembly protein LptD [Bacteroidetes bacterium]|nr:MAG: LPS-assembly protein LptD [Bacteroidota bacterium]
MLLLLQVAIAWSQQNPFDTTAVRSDSVKVDSLRTDSLQAKSDTVKSSTGVDTIVTYTCTDSIVYHFPSRTMSLYKNSTISYQAMELKAEQIGIDWNTNIVNAEGVPDSTDTLHGGYRGTPEMKDGGEQYDGFKLAYNIQTRKGKIDVGDTKLDEGFYHGEDIKKVDSDILFVSEGRFTTCDKPEPHYYFGSPRMKVKTKDQVVAEPVYLYIADVPVFALPFAVFPNKSGRRSGIIAPAYGEHGGRGRFLRHLGYYWAMNDYIDWKIQSDLYTKGGWAVNSLVQYNVRYDFSGSLSGNFERTILGEETDPGRSESESYTLDLTHHQEIDPTMRLDANLSFASNNAYQNTIDYDQTLRQLITSNASFSKNWESPNSINIGYQRQQNLRDESIFETLPSLHFNHGTSYPLRRKKIPEGSSELRWYEMIGFNYSLDGSNSRSKQKVSVDGIKTNINGIDTIQSVDDFQRGSAQRIGQGASISIAPKLGYFTISPRLNFSDSRDFSSTDTPGANPADSSLMVTTTTDEHRAGTLSSGLSFSTRLFGIAQPNMLGVAAIRHTFSPNLSFTYDKQVYGDNTNERRMYASLNISNLFEMKTIPEEEGKEGKKIQLLNVGMGTSYDFTADSLHLAPLRMNFSTRLGSILDISGGTTFDFYQLVQTSGGGYQRVNTFLLGSEGRLARMTDFSLSLSTSLSGERKKSEGQAPPTDTTRLATQQLLRPTRMYDGMPEPDFSIPWQLRLQWHYSESKIPPGSRASSIDAGLEFNLTEKWKFSVNSGYDVINKDFIYPRVAISRDLHCWLMNFSWVPIGGNRSYQFEIRVKASQLQDLKVTKSGSDKGY